MKNLYLFLVITLLSTKFTMAQDLVGKITDQDSAHTPLFMAEVAQILNGTRINTYKTYFDGTFRIKVKPGLSYDLHVSFPGRSDTTVSISVDKHGTLYSGTLFISLRKDGLRLTGFIMDAAQDIPIKDACIILRNVMTREEERFTTDVSGGYNLKMDYETNYTLRIDKMSPGILNKYADTSLSISTIGFNRPLDFRLDIKLGPTDGYIAPRPEYDPHAKHINRNLKPSLIVLGVKDSIQKHRQDSLITALNLQMNRKDSSIASLDKQINDINKAKTENKVALRDMDEEDKKRDEEATRMSQEADKIKQQLDDEQKKKELAKSEADLKIKQQAEKELQAKLDKEIKEAEARRIEQNKQAEEKERNDRAARVQAQEDSLLKIALVKNKEILTRRKHVVDSLKNIENQKAIANNDVPAPTARQTSQVAIIPPTDQQQREQQLQDSLLRAAEAKNREIMAHRKKVLDSLINIESQKVQVKTDTRGADEQARVKDSIRIQQNILADKIRKAQADRVQAEQDSLLRIAEAKNREMQARHKRIQDSLGRIENQSLQAKNEALKMEREKQEYELSEKRAREKREHDAEAAQQAEIAEKEKQAKELANMKKARDEKEQESARRADQAAADRRTQLEKDLAAMKKAREDAEQKVLNERREKEAVDKMSKKESRRLAKEFADESRKQKLAEEEIKRKTEDEQRVIAQRKEAENEQRELEAKKALEEQEKKQLTQQLGDLSKYKDEESTVTKDQGTKRAEYNPDQALKDEKDEAVKAYEVGVMRDNKSKAEAMAKNSRSPGASNIGNKLIKAKGFVKNGQTEDPVPNVSINIRRLNSVVSQEVTSDANGRYDIIVDSGYFYLVSFYKDKYEISKQILDLTSYPREDYTMVIQYMKERDDFDPNAKMPVVQFDKNSSKLPEDIWTDLQSIVKMMKDVPDLKIKLYGLASLDEDYPMELSVTRARLVADLVLQSGIKPSRVRINGIGAYRPRSGCTEGKTCTEEQYKLDRVVMYKVVKE